MTSSWHSVWERSRASSWPRWSVPDDHRAGQLGTAHPEDVLGDVVEQQRHMEGTRPAQCEEGCGPGGLSLDDLTVSPGSAFEVEARPVVRPPSRIRASMVDIFDLAVDPESGSRHDRRGLRPGQPGTNL